MPRLERTGSGWAYGDQLIRAVFNIEDIKQAELYEYPDNQEHADYFLTTNKWRLRVKACRLRHANSTPKPWHLQTLRTSDSVFYVMSGQGEALLKKDTWAPVRT